MLGFTKPVVIGLSAGAIAIFTAFVFKRWLNDSVDDPEKAPANFSENKILLPNNTVFVCERKDSGRGTGIGATEVSGSVNVPSEVAVGGDVAVNYYKLEPAISVKNSRLSVLLKFVIEKSAYKNEQESLSRSGCLAAIVEVSSSTNNPAIRALCFKILTNISTNPDMLDRFVKPLVPLLYDTLTDEEEVEDENETLVPLLALLVNITSLVSHSEDVICDYHLKTIPQLLSRYTPQINYHYDIVLSTLKILINMTIAKMSFELSLVYMSLIHLLHGCKNNAILLRVLTLLRNILTSQHLKHDYTFDDELMRGIGTVLSSNEDKECLDIANQIYRIISEH